MEMVSKGKLGPWRTWWCFSPPLRTGRAELDQWEMKLEVGKGIRNRKEKWYR